MQRRTTTVSLGTDFHIRGRTRYVRRRIPRLILILGLTGVLALALSAFGRSFLQVYRLEREAARLVRVKQSLQEQNAVLREEIKLLHTLAYIERIAREQLGLVKPGEIAVLIVRSPADPAAGPGQTPRQQSWTTRLRKFLTQILH